MSSRTSRPTLSDAEWQIMQVVWRHGSLALGDIVRVLPKGQQWAYSTVRTFVQRLAQKKWLKARRVGNSYLYSAAVKRQVAVGSAIGEFSQRVLGGMLSLFVAHFAEGKDLSDEEIAELSALLASVKEKRARKTES